MGRIEGVRTSVGTEAGKIGSAMLVSVSTLAPSHGDETAGVGLGLDSPTLIASAPTAPALTNVAPVVAILSCIPSPMVGSGRAGGDMLDEGSVRVPRPRAVLVLLLFRGERGDLRVRLPRDNFPSAAACFSRAACSSGEGITSFIFRSPDVRFSTSSDGGTWSDSLDGRKAFGTLGTGGALRGLADRLGVAGRELFDFRRPVTVPVADFIDAAEDALLVGLAELSNLPISIGATPLTLFLRLASTEGDSPEGLGRSLPSIVVRRFLRMACWRGVAGRGE